MTYQLKGAEPKAIFGADNRQDIYQSPLQIQQMSSGLATWLSEYFTEENGIGVDLIFPSIGKEYYLCPGEKFEKQPTTMISCTGFLVAPNLLMTAGHCLVNVGMAQNEVTPMCEGFKWLFDYKFSHAGEEILKGVSKEKMATCKNVIYAIHDGEGNARQDWALIELDRSYPDRFVFNQFAKNIKKGMGSSILGFPSGLPLKYSRGAFILKENHEAQYFEANLDAVGGNSGSPVFNNRNELQGILVRGNVDFITDKTKNCDRWNRCSTNGKQCDDGAQEQDYSSGMHVQKITPEIIEMIELSKRARP